MTKAVNKKYAVISAVLAVLMLISYGMFAISVQSSTVGVKPYQPSGDGTAENPYQIGKAEELYWFAEEVNNGNTSINAVLTKSFSVNDNVLVNGVLSENATSFEPWTPIGNTARKYKGTFDGKGYTISGLYCDRNEEYAGLFGYITDGAEIKNVGVVDSYLCGTKYVGGLVSCNQSYETSSTISNCYIIGNVTASSTTYVNVGGLVGCNQSYETSSITINNCYSIGNVTASTASDYIAYAGGLVGYNDVYGSSSITMNNCYSIGDIIVPEARCAYAGRICGYNSIAQSGSITISNCYNKGTIKVTGRVEYDSSNSGVVVANCYYLADSETAERKGLTGKTEAQFAKGEVAYLLQDNQTADESGNKPQVWGQDLSDGENKQYYPVFSDKRVYGKADCSGNVYCSNDENDLANVQEGHQYAKGICSICNEYEPAVLNTTKYDINGDSAFDEVYEISNEGQLYWFAEEVNNGNTSINAVLTNSFSVNENVLVDGALNSDNASIFKQWKPIGKLSASYSGTFDGQGYTISGLYCSSTDNQYVGLFGYANGTIKNVNVVDSYFYSGAYSANVGGICGENTKTIEKCYSNAVVKGENSQYANVGGICGRNYVENSIIENCYSVGSTAGYYVGGICGSNAGTIKNSYSCGSIGDGTNGGGICSYNDGSIENCYYDSSKYTGNAIGYDENYVSSAKTTEQFTKGEVAYLLQENQTADESGNKPQVWGQDLSDGENKQYYPVFSDKRVYGKADCSGNVYCSNDEKDLPDVQADHQYVKGICSICNEYEPAVLTTTKYDIDGDEEKDEVYEISNAGQLYWFADYVDQGNPYINAVLTNSFSVNDNVLVNGALNSDNASTFKQWNPIGKLSASYSGTFDGQGYTISGLYCSSTDNQYIGLFGLARKTIKNVNVTDSYFYSGAYSANVGGICGYNSKLIEKCYSNAVVKGENSQYAKVGGICGYNEKLIENCYSAGSAAGYYVGGLCGKNYGTIKNSYSCGSIGGSLGECIVKGGVCGSNDNNIENCYYDSSKYTGDAVENNKNYTSSSAKTTEQFTKGEVAYLLQENQTADESGNKPQVWGQDLSDGENKQDYPVFSEKRVYGKVNCVGKVYCSNNENDLANVHEGHQYVKGICSVCNEYEPAVLNKTDYDIDGDGEKDEVYEISNAGQLYWFADYVNQGNLYENAVLTKSFSVNDNVLVNGALNSDNASTFKQWNPIGYYNNNYSGIFDGQGYTISGLCCNNNTNTGYVGLFGFAKGTIKNVNVTDSYFYSNIDSVRVGGICGLNKGKIEKSFCNAVVKSVTNNLSKVGGICGYNDGSIENCYSAGSVAGQEAGGICGLNNAAIKNSYSSGSIGDSVIAGGLSGSGYGGFENCYYDSSKYTGKAVGSNESYTSSAKTTEQFTSGEVAYLLNGSTSTGTLVWGQTLTGKNKDAYPVFGGKTVYQQASGSKYANSLITTAKITADAPSFNADTTMYDKDGKEVEFAYDENADVTTVYVKIDGAEADVKPIIKITGGNGTVESQTWTAVNNIYYAQFIGDFADFGTIEVTYKGAESVTITTTTSTEEDA